MESKETLTCLGVGSFEQMASLKSLVGALLFDAVFTKREVLVASVEGV